MTKRYFEQLAEIADSFTAATTGCGVFGSSRRRARRNG